MPNSVHISNLSQYLQRSFPPGVTVNVLPGTSSYLTHAATRTGLTVRPLEAAKWPFSSLIMLYASGYAPLRPTLVGKAEIEFHNEYRDHFAQSMNVNGAAITEVKLTAIGTRLSAVADIIGRGPDVPGDAPQVVVDIKTGTFGDIKSNQAYVYALALLGSHLQSFELRLPKVGLVPAAPLPAMDFLLVTVKDEDSSPEFAFIKASEVTNAYSFAQIMATISAL